MDNSWVSWVIQSITLLGIGAIGFFLKRTLSQIDSKFKDQDTRIDQLEKKQDERFEQMQKETQQFINQLPFTYTLREDFLRTVANFDKKLDKILDKLSETKGGCA